MRKEVLSRDIMWRRTDTTGMETCAIGQSDDEHNIIGAAFFMQEGKPARLEYHVICRSDWTCQKATVNRWNGTHKTKFSLIRTVEGRWAIDDKFVPDVDGLVDIDLGFTPATNTNAIKRLNLEVGEEAEFTAVWLDDESWAFKPPRQRYERLAENL